MRPELQRLQELLSRVASAPPQPEERQVPAGFQLKTRGLDHVYVRQEELPWTTRAPAGAICSNPLPADAGALLSLADAGYQDLIFLDTETTGLGGAGVYSFLVGLGRWRSDRLVVTQLLMPDPAQERALLETLQDYWPERPVLVTYNGRAFDWPLLVDRCVMHGQPTPGYRAHVDLLFWVRRLLGGTLTDCRLASVEGQVLGQLRPEGIAGFQVPQAYFAYLRTGSTRELERVIERNRGDIVALARLIQEIAAYGQGQLPLARRGRILLGLGRTYEERGELASARRHYQAALENAAAPVQRQELMKRLGFVCKRQGDGPAARDWFVLAHSEYPQDPEPAVEVAKYCEHADGNYAGAHHWTVRALASLGQDKLAWRPRLFHRLARLDRKLQGKRGNKPMPSG